MFVAAGLAIIYLLPRLMTAIPSPLVCIAVLTAGAIGLDLRTVGTVGELPSTCRCSCCPKSPCRWRR